MDSIRADEFKEALPSRVIEIALEDLETVEQMTQQYEVIMHVYHVPNHGKCAVCMAGCVMANTYNVDSTESWEPHSFPSDIRNRLKAIDKFRMGFVLSGLEQMGFLRKDQIDVARKLSFVAKENDYRDNPEQFKARQRQLINDLKALGL